MNSVTCVVVVVVVDFVVVDDDVVLPTHVNQTDGLMMKTEHQQQKQ